MSSLRYIDLIERYQHFLIPIALFSALTAASFGFSTTGIWLVWKDYFFVPLILISLSMIIMYVWIAIEKRRLTQMTAEIKEINTNPIDFNLLTARQVEIYQLIMKGYSNKEIASSLYIEMSTLKTHINHLYKKLGVKSRKELKRLDSKD